MKEIHYKSFSISDYLIEAEKDYSKNKSTQRRGQSFFNTLANLFPEIANKISGTEFDPFYKDNDVELSNFFTKLEDFEGSHFKQDM